MTQPESKTAASKEIKVDVTVTVEGDEDKKPQKRLTDDNGFLPWGSMLFIAGLVMTASFIYLCAVEWTDAVEKIFIGGIIAFAVILVPYSFRNDKVMTQNHEYPKSLGEYLD